MCLLLNFSPLLFPLKTTAFVLGITIDFQNHQNVITYLGFNALYYLSLLLYVMSYTTLIVSWCRVVRRSLPTKFYAKLVDVVHVTGIINLCSIAMFFALNLPHLRSPTSESRLLIFQKNKKQQLSLVGFLSNLNR